MAKSSPPNAITEPAAEVAPGKGHATPTRREKEAARKRPLVSGDRAEARRQARIHSQVQREKARIGMASGEEKYLPSRDRGPQKRYVRDYVDARFSVGELMIPLMFFVIILTFFPQPEVQNVAILTLWAFFLVVIADSIVLGLVVRRKLAAKFSQVEKVRLYAAMRAVQLRLMRLPKPQVKRGQFPA